MLLKPIKCPKCGAPIKGKERDLMLQCPSCGTIQFFDRTIKATRAIAYRIVAPAGESRDTLVYIPFWIVHAELNVMEEKMSGGTIRRAFSDKKKMRGDRDFYICGTEVIPEEVSRVWNMDLTIDQPQLAVESGFRPASRLVMAMEEDTAVSAAEFLFLRYETELPGVLQQLDYVFTPRQTSIVYIPAWKNESGYRLAI